MIAHALLFRPVLPTWLLVVAAVALVGFTTWRVVAERRDRGQRSRWLRRLVVVLLLLVVAVRPSLTGGTAQASLAKLNVFVVVDSTSSVAAEDWGDGRPRLEGVRADVATLADELAGARFALISFDSSAVLRTPLTSDAGSVVTAVDVLRQEITTYSSGSTITEAHDLLRDQLDAAREADPSRANVVFYLGDGEQTADSEPGSFADLAGDVDGGAVLGYGTDEGGRMREFDGYADEYSDLGYIEDRTQPGSPEALSRIDEDALRTLAGQLGVPYVHREPDVDLAPVLADAKEGRVASDEGTAESLTDLYWIAAVPLFLLVLVDVGLVVGALGEVRPPRRGRPSRPGDDEPRPVRPHHQGGPA